MENNMFISKNDRQDESLTGQVRDQAGHCPLTGRYFQPFLILLRSLRVNILKQLFTFSNYLPLPII